MVLNDDPIAQGILSAYVRDLPDYNPNMTFKEMKALLRRKDILNDIIEQAEKDRNHEGTDNGTTR